CDLGAPVERLLKQMQEAGLKHKTADAVVSDEEKQKLLDYLKTSHGEAGGEPKKITLQRKTTTTLKTGSGSARKTVNVEVRKKRTYVKRDEADLQPAEPVAQEQEELPVEQEAVVTPVVETAPVAAPEPEKEVVADVQPEADKVEVAAEPVVAPSSFTDGVEEKRRAAQERRMAEEAQRKAEALAKEEAKRAEQSRAEESEAAAKPEVEAPRGAKPKAAAVPSAPAADKDDKHGKKREA